MLALRAIGALAAGLMLESGAVANAQTTPIGTRSGAATPSSAASGLGSSAAAPATLVPGGGSVATSITLPSVQVIGNAPLPGSGIDIDKVPANVQSLGAQQLWPPGQNELVPTAAARELSQVDLNNEQGSQFQPDFVYRGFEASPISGIPQGIAVYQNGVRINEAFGDTVNWDLIPQFAVDRFTLQGNNPVFGLNALGGAVTMEMKNGFTFHGTDAQLSGGSFGNVNGYAQEGVQFGNFAFYGAFGGTHDDGFRYHSPTALTQGYLDFGWESNPLTVHLSVSAADDVIGATGPTPIQLLKQDIRSVFTYPQSMHNEAELVQLTGTYKPADFVLLSDDVYYRHFNQHLVDGNTTDVTACTNDGDFFCLEGNDLYPADALYDSTGNQVPTSVLPPGATPGEIDYTMTDTKTFGSGLQAKFTNDVVDRENNLVVGATGDHSITNYSAFGELGTLLPSLDVIGSGEVIDQGLSITASPPLEQPVGVLGLNEYLGVYATDTLNITPRLAATVSGRYNLALIGLQDQTGIAPQLNGTNVYGHVNPGVGLTYKFLDNLTGYVGWSEGNRAPTPGELSCANPVTPCLLDAFLVADPPLKQVVSHTFEAGVRGQLATPQTIPGQVHWNLGIYRTNAFDDILLLATQINGFGYFSNVGTTRRQGIEAGLTYNWEKWTANLNYSFLSATFLENLTLSSNSPAVDANGNIFVHPGDTLPLMPQNRVVLDVEYQATSYWNIGADTKFVGSQFLVGDESNQESKLPAYGVVNLHTTLKINKWASFFVNVDNLFDRTYYTYGTFTQLDGLPPNFNLTNPETLSPSPGRVVYAGLHATF
ncbi:MAG TPA: TonB-dependent receptor [Bradyrhizobium sp.]|nr:TonB-dependent receptor [Bradyrhizobium sp.]